MPKSCCAFGCSSNIKTSPELKYYLIPKDQLRRKLWIEAISRNDIDKEGNIIKNKLWSPKSRFHYVCSKHFISGEKKNALNDPDYIPTLFSAFNKPEIQYLSNKKQKIVSSLSVDSTLKCSSMEVNEIPLVCLSSSTNFVKSQLMDSERVSIYAEMDSLRAEIKILNDRQQSNYISSCSSQALRVNPQSCIMLTGLKLEVFIHLTDYLCKGYENDQLTSKENMEDQIILTIVKLRHNITFKMLAHICNICKTSAIKYFWKWLDVMAEKLLFLIRMECREHIFDTIPPVFKSKFPRLTCVIDCFEIYIESPGPFLAKAQCYSNYKKHSTLKVFISCTPLGVINFVSKCWGGRASDNQIVRESNFTSLKYHCPGDQILADRGFTLQDDFAANSSSELLILENSIS
ncbi:uncharacterized protein LOC136082189 [Hydra vulgaris]|uniref:Uncharacterized protein LOC136082189 n=1 Tax=Hydra vulgaris TaxID=6087 RepID=A0ABM4C5B8_HYDVU